MAVMLRATQHPSLSLGLNLISTLGRTQGDDNETSERGNGRHAEGNSIAVRGKLRRAICLTPSPGRRGKVGMGASAIA
jgi:hypothetical protein